MIPQKLDCFNKLFSHNESGGLWLSATVIPIHHVLFAGDMVKIVTLFVESGKAQLGTRPASLRFSVYPKHIIDSTT